MMFRIAVKNEKAAEKCLYYDVSAVSLNKNAIGKYSDPGRFGALCKAGCPNYNNKWSCPPFAPSYNAFASGFEYLTICLLSIDLKQFSYIKNDYMKIKAAHIILKSRIDKALRQIFDPEHHSISPGSCKLCRTCRCKSGTACRYPAKMTYSFESLGINVPAMVQDFLHFPLQWYKKGALPDYTSVVAGLLTRKPYDAGEIFKALESVG